MASHVVEGYTGPLPPPPAVYLRSSPPPHPAAPIDPPPPPPPLSSAEDHRRESIEPAVKNVPKRKPVSVPPIDVDGSAIMHNSPVSPVRIDDQPLTLPQASSAQIENVSVDGRNQNSFDMGDRTKENLPPRRSSLAAASPYLPYRPKPEPGSEFTQNIPPRKDSLSNAPYRVSDETSQSKSRHGSSHGSVESIPPNNEVYEPLQYHHQPFPGHLRERHGNRGSKSTLVSNSDSSSMGDPTNSQNYLAPNRHSRGNLNLIPRPNSAYSSTSELAGRGRSPQLSPNTHTRAVSANSTGSRDARPLSFVDLLNVPYPQPPPAPATLSNAHLRSSVGNNASLLSHKQTFDMYLANVKKTNDAGAQYEFAVFMIHATQEQQQQQDEPSAGGPPSDMVSDIPKAELLREAKSILQRLADRSYPYAQYYLADGYASGLFNKGKPDYDKAFPLFVAASKHGHAEAGYRAALSYEFGWGSRKDGAKAVQFYRQAASKNHPGAMSRLGRACLSGDMGQVKRYREGITWLKRAAESADTQYNSAPYDLGVLHETGYGDDVFQDESYAAQLFTRAAELGHAEANYRLGDAYEHGKLSCPRDPALSVHFYTGAAQLGHPTAMMALCAWFMVGAEPMLEKDEYEAYEWARRAADLGLAKAQYAVGYFTEMGIGCQRDPLEANVWYVRAADQGDERAKHRIAAIRAAASGANPKSAASNRKHKGQQQHQEQPEGSGKGKRFGIF